MINCRSLYKYDISHYSERNHLSMIDDQELVDDQLPAGHTPVWIEPPTGATQVQKLEGVETMAGQYQDVMVLYKYSDRRAAVWCEERGWEYHDATDIFGCEAQCVILLDCWLESEYLTRARNMLIIVNNNG